MPTTEREVALRAVLATVAPGTWLRDGTERILRGNTGALIVLGWDPTVESLCTGGFPLSVEIVGHPPAGTRARWTARWCSPPTARGFSGRPHTSCPTPRCRPRNPAPDTGRPQRVAVQTGYPVISVSQSMRIIGLYLGTRRHVLESSSELLSRANQAHRHP